MLDKVGNRTGKGLQFRRERTKLTMHTIKNDEIKQ
jgi:hypothetical protein